MNQQDNNRPSNPQGGQNLQQGQGQRSQASDAGFDEQRDSSHPQSVGQGTTGQGRSSGSDRSGASSGSQRGSQSGTGSEGGGSASSGSSSRGSGSSERGSSGSRNR